MFPPFAELNWGSTGCAKFDHGGVLPPPSAAAGVVLDAAGAIAVTEVWNSGVSVSFDHCGTGAACTLFGWVASGGPVMKTGSLAVGAESGPPTLVGIGRKP